MRCKRHISDRSSIIGVCATCLRERLLALSDCDPRTSDPGSPPPFPRSVSPYVSRLISADSPWNHRPCRRRTRNDPPDRRFFSTPQLGPSSGAAAASFFTEEKEKDRRKRGKLSFLYGLFRPRSSKCDAKPRISTDSALSLPNWLPSGRRKNPRPSANRPVVDRGASPEQHPDDCEGSPWVSGYSSEARRTPVSAVGRQGRLGHARSASGLAFCLSPLVRASPGKQWNQKAVVPPEGSFSGEFRVPNKGDLYFRPNRSRKLVDLGRFNPNR